MIRPVIIAGIVCGLGRCSNVHVSSFLCSCCGEALSPPPFLKGDDSDGDGDRRAGAGGDGIEGNIDGPVVVL